MAPLVALLLFVADLPCEGAFLVARHDAPSERDDRTGPGLKALSDEELFQGTTGAIRQLGEGSREDQQVPYEACLTELVRRGGPRIEAFLNEAQTILRQHYREQLRDHFPGEEIVYPDLELLTALRRVQNKPDPLRIFVEGPQTIECEFPELPRLTVAIRNVDADRWAVGFTHGGDYRTGRLERWRVEIRGAGARRWNGPLEDPDAGLIMAGGLSRRLNLQPGEAWNTTLPLEDYVQVEKPGEYEIRVYYHDQLTIAKRDTIDGLIASRSDPVRLILKPRTIRLTHGDRESAAKWLAALDESEPLRIVVGGYGEDAHGFLAPASPPGRLLSMGWKAVPVLIESLGDEDLTTARRGWILSLLFSITGKNDPRRHGVIARYRSFKPGWAVFGHLDGQGPSGGFSLDVPATKPAGSGDFSALIDLIQKGQDEQADRAVNAETQRAFARRWKDWDRFLIVKTEADLYVE